MTTVVRATDDPAWVLEEAGPFLLGDPVRHNLILTLLHARVANPEPGRYWIVEVDGVTAGVVFQSPLDFMATVTPMSHEAVEAAVDAIVEQGVRLPEVNGVAATAARFAGQWTERTKSTATPTQGNRIYEVEDVVAPRPCAGSLRPARTADRSLLIDWSNAFQAESGAGVGETEPVVDRRLAAGQFWLWEDKEAVSMAGITDPVANVVRVAPVYTPPERRNRGYAAGLVAAISESALAEGYRCILHTDLGNPTSNSVYRAIGYRAVDEALRYDFA